MKKFLNDVKVSFRSLSNPKTITFAAMLIALNVILTRFLSIQTPILRIGFGFLPVAVFAMLFGPIPGAIAAAIGDVIGVLLFSTGTIYLGFTLSAFLSGLIFGVFLYKQNITIAKIIISNFIIVLFIDMLLNTFWLSLMTKNAFNIIIYTRLIKIVILPIQIMIIYLFEKYIGKRLKQQFNL